MARLAVTRPRLVVVGNGMAGMRTVEELLKLAPDAYDITVFGSEPHPNYNRILLSPVLAGEQTLDEIVLNAREWYAENGITLHAGQDDHAHRSRAPRRGETADGIDGTLRPPAARHGLDAVHPAGPGRDLPGVITYRDIADTEAMIDAARAYRACRRHRRRPARARSGERPEAARHGRDGRAPHAVAHGAAARPHGCATCCRKALEAKGLASASKRRRKRWSRRVAAASPGASSLAARSCRRISS